MSRVTRAGVITIARIVVPLLPILVILVQADVLGQPAADPVVGGIEAFVRTLTPAQRQKATFAFSDTQRFDWHFIPQKVRAGLPVKEMTPPQREAARVVLRAALSSDGYTKVSHVMNDLEVVLLDLEGVRTDGVIRDPEAYFFTLFGTPGDRRGWGWRWEGHHVSLNFTYLNGEVIASTPSFLGAYPAEVRSGPHKGLRVLAREMDLGLALLQSLTPEQRRRTVFRPGIGALNGGAPGEIFTYNAARANPIHPPGLLASEMTAAQKDILRSLVTTYASHMPARIASQRLQRVEAAGFDRIGFAWAGQDRAGQPHYYKIQGPTFLIEYDNTQNDNNHIHTVWREFHGDFGEDLLRMHYDRVAHAR